MPEFTDFLKGNSQMSDISNFFKQQLGKHFSPISSGTNFLNNVF